jgi:hypothetical protein
MGRVGRDVEAVEQPPRDRRKRWLTSAGGGREHANAWRRERTLDRVAKQPCASQPRGADDRDHRALARTQEAIERTVERADFSRALEQRRVHRQRVVSWGFERRSAKSAAASGGTDERAHIQGTSVPQWSPRAPGAQKPRA